jgi:hypothetical protein
MEADDEAVASVGLTNGSLGNIRTLRAMDAATFERVLQNVG